MFELSNKTKLTIVGLDDDFAIKMNNYLSTLENKWDLEILKPDTEGARIVNE